MPHLRRHSAQNLSPRRLPFHRVTPKRCFSFSVISSYAQPCGFVVRHCAFKSPTPAQFCGNVAVICGRQSKGRGVALPPFNSLSYLSYKSSACHRVLLMCCNFLEQLSALYCPYATRKQQISGFLDSMTFYFLAYLKQAFVDVKLALCLRLIFLHYEEDLQ